MAQAGVSMYQVRDVLGHSSVQMTERYAHLWPGHLRDAVNSLVEPNRDQAVHEQA